MDLALTIACRSDEEQVQSELIDGEFLEDVKDALCVISDGAWDEVCEHIQSLIGEGKSLGPEFDEFAKNLINSLKPKVNAKYAA